MEKDKGHPAFSRTPGDKALDTAPFQPPWRWVGKVALTQPQNRCPRLRLADVPDIDRPMSGTSILGCFHALVWHADIFCVETVCVSCCAEGVRKPRLLRQKQVVQYDLWQKKRIR
ncbi:MAG: hypothetical protein K2J84_02440 [Bacteroidaceae bacterium]|nr:hypothetical protein [Bacteroidaceae bacterium]